MSALRVAFAGTPDFSVPAFEALLNSGHMVVGVLTQPDRPKGRGRQLAASPVKVAALAHGIPISQPITLKEEAARAELAAWRPDVLVVVAYGLILPTTVLALPRLGCLNIHGSLLPRWRGAAPIQRAVLAGDANTGVTIMVMDAGLDTGPMLLKKEVPIEPGDTGGSLHDRLSVLGASALIEALTGYASETLRAVPQPTEGVTYASKIEKGEALIDWRLDAVQIERQIRAFNPWPIAETRLGGEQLRVYEAVLEGSRYSVTSETAVAAAVGDRDISREGQSVESGGAPGGCVEAGTIIDVQPDRLIIQCGRGLLALRQLQRPGRRVVSAGDFARGGVDLTGRRLG